MLFCSMIKSSSLWVGAVLISMTARHKVVSTSPLVMAEVREREREEIGMEESIVGDRSNNEIKGRVFLVF